jgi:Tol biopolymer transport system component
VKHPEGTLWRSRVDGSEPLQLTFAPYGADGPHWSPDGRRIAFRASLPGQPRRIYTISADGGIPRELLPADENKKEEGIPTWSADGGSIVFGELRYSPDKIAIHVLERASGKVSRLPGSEGLWTPRWSPDGRFILALTADAVSSLSGSLMLFDLNIRKWKTLVQDDIAEVSWSRDGRFIYFSTGYPNPAIKRVRISDGIIEKIVDLRNFTPESDASFGVYLGVAPDDSPLMLRKVYQTEIYALKMKW